MKKMPVFALIAALFSMAVSGQSVAVKKPKLVTPEAIPEAEALLNFFYNISGQYTLTGQHNYPASGDRNSRFARMYIGKTPVIWSQDFGFAAARDKDSYRVRPATVQIAMREHQRGNLVTLCWHAVPPTAREPVTFLPQPGSEGQPLASVQGRLTDDQFRDLLTPGTDIYNRWAEQVDEIARYLKMLDEKHIPVLLRPYHEMNGDWFWWGGRYQGQYTTAALYRQLFDRLVHVHQLHNLIWVWSVDRPTNPDRAFAHYYPGDDYVDILALDVYGGDFAQSYYDDLVALSGGKPVALGEVGTPPPLEVLESQPRWLYWVVWAGMVRNTPYLEYEKYVESPRVLFTEDPAYVDGINPYRRVCDLPLMIPQLRIDLSGNWKLNECASDFGTEGVAPAPYQMNIRQSDSTLQIQSFTVVEWEGDKVARRTVPTDGTESRTASGDLETLQKAHWSNLRDTLYLHTERGPATGEKPWRMVLNENWTLHRGGRILVIIRTKVTPEGKTTARWVYDKI